MCDMRGDMRCDMWCAVCSGRSADRPAQGWSEDHEGETADRGQALRHVSCPLLTWVVCLSLPSCSQSYPHASILHSFHHSHVVQSVQLCQYSYVSTVMSVQSCQHSHVSSRVLTVTLRSWKCSHVAQSYQCSHVSKVMLLQSRHYIYVSTVI